MSILDDVNIERGGQPHVPPPNRGRMGLIVGLIALVALVGALYWWLGRGGPEQEGATAVAVPETTGPAPAEQAELPPTDLPPLTELDPTVRSMIGELSNHPIVTRWLSGTGLSQQAAAIALQVGNGRLPTRLLGSLRPSGSFQTAEQNGATVIDPRTYNRYNGITAAVESIDPARAADVYTRLEPRLEEAYRQLGEGGSIRESVAKAVYGLLDTPEVSGPVRVEPKGGVWVYEDPRLESLTPAQKLLLRMGPSNASRVKARLQAFAQALNLSRPS